MGGWDWIYWVVEGLPFGGEYNMELAFENSLEKDSYWLNSLLGSLLLSMKNL